MGARNRARLGGGDSLCGVPNPSKYVFKNHRTSLKKIRILVFVIFDGDATNLMKLNQTSEVHNS